MTGAIHFVVVSASCGGDLVVCAEAVAGVVVAWTAFMVVVSTTLWLRVVLGMTAAVDVSAWGTTDVVVCESFAGVVVGATVGPTVGTMVGPTVGTMVDAAVVVTLGGMVEAPVVVAAVINVLVVSPLAPAVVVTGSVDWEGACVVVATSLLVEVGTLVGTAVVVSVPQIQSLESVPQSTSDF